MIEIIRRLFKRKRVTVHHVRAMPVDYERRKRSTTARLISEINDADIEARLRQAGVI